MRYYIRALRITLRVANKLSDLGASSGNFCHEVFQSSFLNDDSSALTFWEVQVGY